MTEPTAGSTLTRIANIRQRFERNGFKFTDGKRGEHPRCFGVAAGCTLELIGEAEVEQATMAAVMAHDAEGTARLNGFRMAALMALLAGDAGVKWVGDAMKRAGQQSGQVARVEDTLGPWHLALVNNRRKSALTLKAKRVQP